MKSKVITTVCFGFNEHRIDYYIVNNEGIVLSRNTIDVDFEIINSIGVITNTELVLPLLNDIVTKYQLPNKALVRINLHYLDIKRLFLPTMPINELSQIVKDEAIRESIFSFSHERIAVAYRIVGKSKNDSGVDTEEILAATLPQSVIDSYCQLFKSTGIKLLAIEPAIEGLVKAVPRRLNAQAEAFIILKLSKNESELYIWSNNKPQFWRTIQTGSIDQLHLQQEIKTSLEHFNRKNSEMPAIELLYLFGEEPLFETIENLTIKYLKDEPRLDLGVCDFENNSQLKSEMNFLKFGQKNETSTLSFIRKKWQWLLLTLLVVSNLLVGFQTWLNWKSFEKIKNQYHLSEKEYKVSKEKLTALLNENQKPPINTLNYSSLFDAIRNVVPEEMRLDNITVDTTSKKIELDGFCLQLSCLDQFIHYLSQNNFIKAINFVQSNQAIRSGVTVYTFKILIDLEVQNGY